jgi:hypothetical protein
MLANVLARADAVDATRARPSIRILGAIVSEIPGGRHMPGDRTEDLEKVGDMIARVKRELERTDLDHDTRAKLKRELEIFEQFRFMLLLDPN